MKFAISARSATLIALVSLSASMAIGYTLPAERSIEVTENLKQLDNLSVGIAEITDFASDALVYINVVSNPSSGRQARKMNPFHGPPSREPHHREGVGSGFLIDLNRGYIMTNNHVVSGAGDIRIKLANGNEYAGVIVGSDPNTDIAIVSIKDKAYNRTGLTSLSFSDSNQLRVGHFVVALGAPFGLEASTSFGVVSAMGRGNLGITPMGNFIQTDAAINPGNSGGPLLNTKGQVVGVNTAIASRTGGNSGIGFAVPANLAKEIGTRLIEDGHIVRGYVGAGLGPIDDEQKKIVESLKLASGAGVAEVIKNGPADEGGLMARDIIVKINDTKIENASQAFNHIGLLSPGSDIVLTIIRNNELTTLKLTIGEWPST